MRSSCSERRAALVSADPVRAWRSEEAQIEAAGQRRDPAAGQGAEALQLQSTAPPDRKDGEVQKASQLRRPLVQQPTHHFPSLT